MNALLIFRTREELRNWRRAQPGKVGIVPTMGALHAGHAALLRHLRPLCTHLVLTIFVNPTQFAPHEDLSKYPRSFEADLNLAKETGVDAIFFPFTDQMYPEGYSTWVEETELTSSLCGAFRPGHFRGVTTIVLKLFNLIQPDLAIFGMKDAQQFSVVQKMVQDLDLDIQLIAHPTVREPDGLAMSSRNAYLTDLEREKAPLLYQVLTQAAKEIQKLAGSGVERAPHGSVTDAPDGAVASVLTHAKQTLSENGFTVQYLECRAGVDFKEIKNAADLSQSALSQSAPQIFAAVYLGQTRLIDNVEIAEKAGARH